MHITIQAYLLGLMQNYSQHWRKWCQCLRKWLYRYQTAANSSPCLDAC